MQIFKLAAYIVPMNDAHQASTWQWDLKFIKFLKQSAANVLKMFN